MKVVASFFSGVFQFFTTVFIMAILFATLTFTTCQTMIRNQELKKEKSALSQKVSALTTSLKSLEEDKQTLLATDRRHLQEIEANKKVIDVYDNDLKQEKRLSEKQRIAIGGLSKDTAKLRQQVFKHTKYINQADQERTQLRESVDLMLVENQDMSDDNLALQKEVAKRENIENLLLAKVATLESGNSDLRHSVAVFAANEAKVVQGLKHIEESKRRNLLFTFCWIAIGIAIGIILMAFRKTVSHQFKVFRLRPANTWKVVRSYFI